MTDRGPLVYIAGPLYNEGERWYLERIDDICSKAGFRTFLPHRDAGVCPATGEGSKHYYTVDRDFLDKAAIVVAVLHGASIDPGTAWEIGYAAARGLHVVGLIDDTRIDDPAAAINLMIFNSVTTCRTLPELLTAVQAYRHHMT